MLNAPRKLQKGDRGEKLSSFCSGVDELDEWFHKFAWESQAANNAVTYVATLDDGTGQIVLLLWQNVLEEVPERLDLYPGSQVWVSGRVQEYEGALEIVPRDGAGVGLVAPGDRQPVEERSLGSITPSDEGRVLAVAGTVTRAESHGWLRLWIEDGTGEMLIYLPERLIPHLPGGLGPGVRLAVTGEVDVYQGTLEIIPLAGADVAVR